MVACRNSSENTELMNLILVLNKTSPWAHTESELDVLNVPGKLVKYVENKLKNKIKSSSPKLPKWQSTSFWFQGILGVKCSTCCMN
jgi:hypothetical protein